MTGLARAAVSLAQIVPPADGDWGNEHGAGERGADNVAQQRYSMDAYRGPTGRVAGVGAARVAREVDGLVRFVRCQRARHAACIWDIHMALRRCALWLIYAVG